MRNAIYVVLGVGAAVAGYVALARYRARKAAQVAAALSSPAAPDGDQVEEPPGPSSSVISDGMRARMTAIASTSSGVKLSADESDSLRTSAAPPLAAAY